MPAAPPSAYATTFATATCAAASAVALLAAAHCTSPVASLAVPHPAVSGANNRSVELYYHSRCPSHARRRGHPSYHRASAREGSGKIVSLSSRLKTSSSNEALLCSRGGSDSASGSKSGGGLEGSEPRCSAAKAADTQQEEDAPAPFVLEGVKNIRDLGSIAGSGIVKGRVFRTGHLSDATEADAITLRDDTRLRTMVDLRSATELERDELIHAEVYKGFVNVGGTSEHGTGVWEGPTWDEATMGDESEDTVREEGNGACGDGGGGDGSGDSRRRYFVSLIDEGIYKKGVFQRLRRRHKAAVLALAPAAMVSRRVTQKARGIFMKKINAGGLVLLNELLLQYSGEGINRVLRLMASRERHPVALYCTAGKDRTGLVMALALGALGVPDEAIVDDYAQSEDAYKAMGDRTAMVGALAQEDLDPDTFLSAPRHVMEEILHLIRVKYGSIDGYLDSIGFDGEWRERLRDALLVE